MGSHGWCLSDKERGGTVERLTANIATLAFFKGREFSDQDAKAAAEVIEKKAYAAAQVAARVTTGDRPAGESTSAYARKLGELVLEVVSQRQEQHAREPLAAPGTADEHDLTGARDFLTRETAEEVLAPLLAAGSNIRKIKFSTKSFGSEAAEVAARALTNVAHVLEHADLSDIIAGRPEDEALAALRIISKALVGTKLRHLNLSDNALGEKGVRAAADALSSQPTLEFLALQNVGCSINACSAVAELLTSSGELRGLHLFNNMSDNAGAQHIANILARSPMMEDFKMASSRVGPPGGIALAKGLTAGHNLVRLDVSDNPMTAEVAPALAACLADQPNLRSLNLNDTSLTDEGVATVCGALAGNAPVLEELELALNEVTPLGARAVVKALANKKHLRRLNLRENELENRGAIIIASALAGLPALEEVDLCTNQVQRPGALALARVVAGKAGFKLLALDDNAISDEGVEQIEGILKAAGNPEVLGALDENDSNMTEEEDEEQEGEQEQGGDDALAAALSKVHV